MVIVLFVILLITFLVPSNISSRRTELNVDILLFGGFHYLVLFVYIMPIWPLRFDVHLKKDNKQKVWVWMLICHLIFIYLLFEYKMEVVIWYTFLFIILK